jgi:hypothetical protein
MYYEAEKIESALKCPLCEETFDDPRVIPCGNTCCLMCLTNKFECKLCENVHETDDIVNYPKSHSNKKLLEERKNKISSDYIELKFKKELEKFENKINMLDLNEKNFKDDLNDHCEKMRSQIIVKTECIINEFNKRCDEMCAQIDKYELDSNVEWDTEDEAYRKSLTELINDNRLVQENMKQFYED